jgi:hypothetical protein
VLPTVVGEMVAARGAEESTSWRQPEDLVSLCQTTVAELPSLFAAGRGRERWLDHSALAHLLLGDDAVAIMAALKAAILAGASPTDLGRSLAYAAALRVARFGSANEHSDWETAHHVFTYANAVHRMLKRSAENSRSEHGWAPFQNWLFGEPWRPTETGQACHGVGPHQHTAVYTTLAPNRFKDFWRD